MARNRSLWNSHYNPDGGAQTRGLQWKDLGDEGEKKREQYPGEIQRSRTGRRLRTRIYLRKKTIAEQIKTENGAIGAVADDSMMIKDVEDQCDE